MSRGHSVFLLALIGALVATDRAAAPGAAAEGEEGGGVADRVFVTLKNGVVGAVPVGGVPSIVDRWTITRTYTSAALTSARRARSTGCTDTSRNNHECGDSGVSAEADAGSAPKRLPVWRWGELSSFAFGKEHSAAAAAVVAASVLSATLFGSL